MRRRIIAGMGANSFGMAVTVGIQLASLPLFLYYWDTATYGVWLMLSAIPAYLSMADVGMVTAAGNRMTMAMGRGDADEANRVFQSAQYFMAVTCGCLAAVSVPVVLWAPLPWLENWDQRLALAALVLGVLAALFGGLAEAVFKATHRYAHGTLLGNLVRLGEWAGSIIGLILGGSFAAVAMSGLAARLLGTVAGMLLAGRGANGLRWGVRHARRAEVFAMIRPAFSFMIFPLSNAISFQGVTLLVGAMFGPVAVALFNTYRTIARVAVQVTAIFSHALWPEFSRLFGQGGGAAVNALFQKSFLLGALQAAGLSLLLYFFSPWILELWTHGRIEFVPGLMLLMLLYAATGGLWHVPRVLLMATNRHAGLAGWSLVAAAMMVALARLLGETMQMQGVGLAMVFSELFIVVACAWLAFRMLSAGTVSEAGAA
jgi:O-antigen/teichoic acid export membrane protein